MSLEPIEPDRAVDTVGCNCFKIFSTPGSRNSLQTYSRQYELYLEDRASELSQVSQYGHKSRLGHFTRWCDEQDIGNMNFFSGRDLHRSRLWRRNEGDLAPITEKTQMDTLRVFIRWCETIDAVPADLYTKVVSPSMSEEDDAKDIKLNKEVAEGTLEYLSTYEYASERPVCLQLMWDALLRHGAVRALDVDDYDPQEISLEVRHRPETGSPIKNQELGERFIALDEETCATVDAWIADQRPAVEDEHGRKPLLATSKGRAHVTTIANYIYSVTTPCLVSDECSHDRTIPECSAASARTQASRCPSSVSPHAVRRGAITHWLASDVPEPVLSDRANVSTSILDRHYDRRNGREKMEQRREYLTQI